MTVLPLGKIAVTTAGTPVPVTATKTLCNQIVVSVLAANTGKTYFGTAALVKSTFVGVVVQFLIPPATGAAATFILRPEEGGNQLNAADFWVDADVNGEGLLVTAVQS
jgi:hypothetical protein